MVDSLDLKSSGIYSRGGSSPPEATNYFFINIYTPDTIIMSVPNMVNKSDISI